MSDEAEVTKLPKGFSREQMLKSAEHAYAYECWHVDKAEQARSKADPDEGGILCYACACLHEAGFMLKQLLGVMQTQQAKREVTDEMVERGFLAESRFDGDYPEYSGEDSQALNSPRIRAILEAAINGS